MDNIYENPWSYRSETLLNPPEGYVGFVYIITNLVNDKKYIGQKRFYKIRAVRKKKGQKRRGKSKKSESDWKKYYGSCKALIEDIKTLGRENFKREIITICKTKGELNYRELEEQMNRKVLLDQNYYNGIIQCRINSTHLKGLK